MQRRVLWMGLQQREAADGLAFERGRRKGQREGARPGLGFAVVLAVENGWGEEQRK